MLLAEKKFYEKTMTMNPTTTWAFNSALSGIAQGITDTTRIGTKIFVHSIRFSFDIIGTDVTVNNVVGDICRCVIYHNREAAGATPAGSGGMFNENALTAARFIPMKSRYSIMREMIHSFSPVAAPNDPAASGTALTKWVLQPIGAYAFTVYPKKQIEWNGTAGAITELFKDDYGIACIAKYGQCSMTVKVQVIYTDV